VQRACAVDHITAGDHDVEIHALGVELLAARLGQQLAGHPVVAR
jgi:hypothetical protein